MPNNYHKSCPFCEAPVVRDLGVMKTGYKAYRCFQCKKGFSDSPLSRIKDDWDRTCPFCNASSRRKIGFTKKTGYQRYKCLSCGKCSTDSPFPKGGLPIGDKPKPKSIICMRSRAKIKQEKLKVSEVL